MLPAHPVQSRPSTLPWLAAFTAVIALFFFEHLFLGRSLLPLDVLNQMLLPREAGAAIDVQTHYPIDEITQLAPNAAWWRDSLRRGEFPLWNPHLLGGHPQHGATGWTLLCAFKLPLLLPIPLERAYTLTLVFQFWLAGVLMFALCRELGRSPAAAFLAACAWALCSNFLMFHWLFLNVFTWVPLLLICWERAIARASIPWAFGTSVVMALAFLGGSVQMIAYVGFLWGFWALANFEWKGVGDALRAARWMLGVFAVAALLCAAQWLPTAEFLPRETQRLQNLDPGAFGLVHAVAGPVAALVMFLFPGLAGSPQTFDLLKAIKGNAIDFTAYIGVVPAALAVIGVLAPRDRRARNLLALVAVVLVLVFFTPLQKFLYHRFLLLAVFAAVLFAARGLDALMEGSIPSTVLKRFTLAAVALAVLLEAGLGAAALVIPAKAPALTAALERQVVSGAAANQFGIHLPWLLGRIPRLLAHFKPWNPEFLIPAVCLLGFAWALRRAVRLPGRSGGLVAACLACAVLDLSGTLRDRVPRVDVARNPFYPLPAVLEPLRQDPDWFRVCRWMPGNKLTLMDNLAWMWGFNQVSGYESMSPDGLSRLPLAETNGFNRLLDLAVAKYVITQSTNPLPLGRFETVSEEHGVRLLRNRNWLPQLTLVTNAPLVLEARAAREKVASAGFDPASQVVVEAAPDPDSMQAGQGTSELPRQSWVRVHVRSAQRLTGEVSSPLAGAVVFSETWYPGWKVLVDGKPATLLRADAYLMAVAVPAGLHQVEFRFEPRSFQRGMMVSFVTLGLGSVVSLVASRSRRRELPANS